MSYDARESERRVFGGPEAGGGQDQAEGQSGIFASIVEKGMGFVDTMTENTKALMDSMTNDDNEKETGSKEKGFTWADFKDQYLKPLQPATSLAVDSFFHVKQFVTTELPEAGQETIEFLFKNGGPGGKPEPAREVVVKDIENKWNFV